MGADSLPPELSTIQPSLANAPNWPKHDSYPWPTPGPVSKSKPTRLKRVEIPMRPLRAKKGLRPTRHVNGGSRQGAEIKRSSRALVFLSSMKLALPVLLLAH